MRYCRKGEDLVSYKNKTKDENYIKTRYFAARQHHDSAKVHANSIYTSV